MPKLYTISVPVRDEHIFQVEANSEEEALAKLKEEESSGAGDIGQWFVKTYDGSYQMDAAEVIEEQEVNHG